LKFFGIEFKFNGFDIWHKGNFNPDIKSDVGHTHSALSSNITLGDGGNGEVNQTSGSWWQKLFFIDTADKNVHRFGFSERQGSGDYVELFGVDGNGDVYAKGTKVSKEGHVHTTSSITDFPAALPADGGNADTIEGKRSSDFVLKTGDEMGGKLTLPLINIPHAAAPTSPLNGDMWTTTAAPYMRINGTTRTIIHSGIPTSLASDVSQAEAEVGASTTRRWWTAQRIAQAIASLQAVKSVNGTTGDVNLSIPSKLSQLENDIGAGGGIKITTATIAPSAPSPGDFWYKEI